MSISAEVNIDVLNEVYTLSAFHGLRSAHPNDQWNNQMTEETEGYLPNSDLNTHADITSHVDINNHLKPNPALQAMQRAVGTGGSNETKKQLKPNGGQLDRSSLTTSDHITISINKSIDEYVCFE
jgi:hypothetical protein